MRNVPISWIMNDDYLAHYNHNHDALGRFASSVGSGVSSVGSSVKTTVSKITGGKIGSSKKVKKGPAATVKKTSRKKSQASAKNEIVKTARQRKEEHDRILESGDAKQLYEHRQEFTKKELDAAIEKIRTEETLREIMRYQNPTVMDRTLASIRNLSSKADNLNNIAKTGIDVYKTVKSIQDIQKGVDDAQSKKAKAEASAAVLKEIIDSGARASDIIKRQSELSSEDLSTLTKRLSDLSSVEKAGYDSLKRSRDDRRDMYKFQTDLHKKDQRDAAWKQEEIKARGDRVKKSLDDYHEAEKNSPKFNASSDNPAYDKRVNDIINERYASNSPALDKVNKQRQADAARRKRVDDLMTKVRNSEVEFEVGKSEPTDFDRYFESEVRKEQAKRFKKKIKHSAIVDQDFIVHYNHNHDARGRFASNPLNGNIGMARFNVTGKYKGELTDIRDLKISEVDFNEEAANRNPFDDTLPKATLGEIYPPVANKIKEALEHGEPNPYPREKGFDGLAKQMNPNFGDEGTTNNCCFCAAGMEVGSRGFDIVARRSNGGCTSGIFERWFDGAETIDHRCEVEPDPGNIIQIDDPLKFMDVNSAFKEAKEDILGYGDGASGALITYYAAEDPVANHTWSDKLGGHALHWRNENGKVIIADGQNGEECSIEDVPSKYCTAGNYCSTIRLDNCDINWNALAEDGAFGTANESTRMWTTPRPTGGVDTVHWRTSKEMQIAAAEQWKKMLQQMADDTNKAQEEYYRQLFEAHNNGA